MNIKESMNVSNPDNEITKIFEVKSCEHLDMTQKEADKFLGKNDRVEHPSHYTSHPSGVECIDITRHYCFAIGNVIKYCWRAGLKKEEGLSDDDKELEDLKKARFYLNDRIAQLEKSKMAKDNANRCKKFSNECECIEHK